MCENTLAQPCAARHHAQEHGAYLLAWIRRRRRHCKVAKTCTVLLEGKPPPVHPTPQINVNSKRRVSACGCCARRVFLELRYNFKDVHKRSTATGSPDRDRARPSNRYPSRGRAYTHALCKGSQGKREGSHLATWVGAQGCKRLFGECERRIGFETPV